MVRKILKTMLATLLITILTVSSFCNVYAAGSYTVTFHSSSGTGSEHEGAFDDSSTTNIVSYDSVAYTYQVSHTSNVTNTGAKSSNYGNSWTNANITGTNRGTQSASNAHVITVNNADHLVIELYFNGESISYDWVSVWQGSHPTYTAQGNPTSAGYVTTAMGAPNNANKWGGSSMTGVTFATQNINGNSIASCGHITLTIPGDTVTFAFRSDSSGYGQGYGYYAKIMGYDSSGNKINDTLDTEALTTTEQAITDGTYKEPIASDSDYRFSSWNDASDGTGNTVSDPSSLTSTTNLYAIYEEDIIDKGNYGCAWKLKTDGTLIIGTEGQTCTLTSASGYSSWPWYSNRTNVKSVKFKGTVSTGANLTGMFYGQSYLTDIDFTGFHTNNAKNMDNMFQNCSRLKNLDLSGFDTSKVTNMNSVFFGCSSLTSLDLSSFDTSKVISMYSMFNNCKMLTNLDLSRFDTSNVANMSSMFDGCRKLTSLDLSSFDTSKVTDMKSMFSNCLVLSTLDLSGFDTSKVTSMYGMFYNCLVLTDLNLSGFDTSSVTSMSKMFSCCSALTDISFSGFDTSKVTDMSEMFSECSSLTSLDLSILDTSKVTDMDHMFEGCSSLTALILSSFNTSNVTSMRYMFYGCSSLTSLVVSGFDTSKVTDMDSMFERCSKLTDLNLSSFNTSNVTAMNSMFGDCSKLTSLDLSGFDTSKVTDMRSMFVNTTDLKSVYLPQNFAFNGKGTLTGSDRAFLNGSSSTKKWHRVYNGITMLKDTSDTLYTAQELTDNWDASMAGLWVWEGETLSTSGFGDAAVIDVSVSDWTTVNESTQKIVIPVFDDTQTYYMVEDIMQGFTSDIPSNPGYRIITNGEGHVTNTSTTQTGSLSILKTVIGPKTDKKFPIEIQLSSEQTPLLDFSVELGDQYMELTASPRSGVTINSVNYMDAPASSPEPLNKIDSNRYSYYGYANDGYLVFNTTLNDTTKDTRILINDYFHAGSYDDSLCDEFGENCQLGYYNSWYGTLYSGDSSVYNGTKIIGATVFENGKTTIYLGAGETRTISGLRYGTSYQITELTPANYEMQGTNLSGTINADNTIAIITNTAKENLPMYEEPDKQNIMVRKNVIGEDGNAKYKYTAFLTGLEPNKEYQLSKAAYKEQKKDKEVFYAGLLEVTLEETSSPSNGIEYAREEDIEYKATFKNLGQTAITNITAEFVLGGESIDIEQLSPGQTMEKETFHTVTEEDIINGFYEEELIIDFDSDSHYELQKQFKRIEAPNPKVEFEISNLSSPLGTEYQPGETISYDVKVSNTGNMTLNDITLTNVLTADETNIASFLTPGLNESYSLTYVVTGDEPTLDDNIQIVYSYNATWNDSNNSWDGDIVLSVPLDGDETQADLLQTGVEDNLTFTSDNSGTAYVEFELIDGEEISLTDIPVNATYQITEAAGNYISSYQLSSGTNVASFVKSASENTQKNTSLATSTETVDLGEEAIITYTNRISDYQDVKLSKVVESSPNDETEFEFTAEFDNLEPGKTYNSDIGRIVADDEGHAEKQFYMTNGRTITFEQLPVGSTYKFTESKSSYIASYEITDSQNLNKIIIPSAQNVTAKTALSTYTEKVEKGELVTVAFTNRVERKNLTVVVRAENIDDANKEYHFTVQARDEANPIAGKYSALLTHANGSSEEIELEFNGSGRVEFNLEKNEYIKIKDLPKGISYSVTQTDYKSENIATSYNTQEQRHTTPVNSLDETSWEDGLLINGTLDDDRTEIFLNTTASRTITVRKTVNGNLGNKNDRFTFVLSRNDGQPFSSQDVTITAHKTSSAQTPVPQTDLNVSFSNDLLSFSLGHDETVEITTASGISYTISEENYSSKGYQTYLNNSLTQKRAETFTLNADKVYSYTNTNETIVMTYAKTGLKIILPVLALSIMSMLYLIAKEKQNKKQML